MKCSKKLAIAVVATAVWSSAAIAACEAEQRAYDEAGRNCTQKWTTKNDIAECKNEQNAAAEKKLKQCFRDINAGKRER